jgi:protein-tyrosine-phosphatase
MASAIFKRILEEKGEDTSWRVESAGTWAIDGAGVAGGTALIMQSRGIEIGNHRARTITRELIASFDLILTMERGHKEALRAEFPEHAGRVYMLSEMADLLHDIHDPIGGPIPEFEATAKEISDLLFEGLEKIKSLVIGNLK